MNPGQPEQVSEQSLKREGLSTVGFSPHTTLLAKRSLESRHQLQLLPRMETSHNLSSADWPCPSSNPSIPPGLAPRSDTVGSGCPSSSPRSPESQDRKVQEKERNEFFQGETAKHQLNPKQGKLQPWELTYIVLHVLFRGSEFLVI